jgi:hypothetical protein
MTVYETCFALSVNPQRHFLPINWSKITCQNFWVFPFSIVTYTIFPSTFPGKDFFSVIVPLISKLYDYNWVSTFIINWYLSLNTTDICQIIFIFNSHIINYYQNYFEELVEHKIFIFSFDFIYIFSNTIWCAVKSHTYAHTHAQTHTHTHTHTQTQTSRKSLWFDKGCSTTGFPTCSNYSE